MKRCIVGCMNALGILLLGFFLCLMVPALIDVQDARGADKSKVVGDGPFVGFAFNPDYTVYGLGRGQTHDEAKARAVESCGDAGCKKGEQGSAMPGCVSIAKSKDGHFASSLDFGSKPPDKHALKECEKEFGGPCTIVDGACAN